MNQEQVKEILLDLKSDVEPFALIFSGTTSRRVNGLYKPENMEIIIHNQNFTTNHELVYTAIHEFAHHILFTEQDSLIKKYKRSHNSEFYDLFYKLLQKAETMKYYKLEYDQDPELLQITDMILSQYIHSSGEVMKKLGGLLLKAQRICRQKGIRFEDYLDRIINIPRNSADLMIKSSAYDLQEQLGYEKMKVIAKIRDPLKRESATKKLLTQNPIESVKQQLKPTELEEPIEKLLKEKSRVEKSIERLKIYLTEIDEEIKRNKFTDPSQVFNNQSSDPQNQ